MWKATAGHNTNGSKVENTEDDNWETDPDFVNDVTEEEQRWGSKTVQGSGRTAGAIDMQKLREETALGDAQMKQKQLNDGPKAAFGYGGKFGVQQDRMDKSAVGHDYAVPLQKHDSQRDYATGFGGKFGIQTDRQDKSAVGWDHVEQAQKHQSQKDYSVGFGGKFGVQTDRQDKSAVGWEHQETIPQHESQVDHKKGFGGKYGLQTDRVDKSALSFDDSPEKVGTKYEKVKPDIGSAKPSSLRAKFEEMAKGNDNAAKEKAIEERRKREEREKKELEREEARKRAEEQKLQEEANKQAAVLPPSQAEPEVESQPEPVRQIVEPPKAFQEPPTPVQEPAEEAQPTSTSEPVVQAAEPEAEPEEEVFEDSSPVTANTDMFSEEQELGYTAVALYDYQAGADDEISFDPDDIITNIEMIDEGWWRGFCKDKFGLFPANYVQLQQEQ